MLQLQLNKDLLPLALSLSSYLEEENSEHVSLIRNLEFSDLFLMAQELMTTNKRFLSTQWANALSTPDKLTTALINICHSRDH